MKDRFSYRSNKIQQSTVMGRDFVMKFPSYPLSNTLYKIWALFLTRPSPEMHNSSIQPDISLYFTEIYSQKPSKIFPSYNKLHRVKKFFFFLDLFYLFLCKTNQTQNLILQTFLTLRRAKSHDNHR